LSTNYFYDLAKQKLFTLCRSITGSGIRETLKIIKNEFPELKINHVKSGTKAFDWTIPPEWNIKTAYVLDKYGNKIINFNENNLHVVGYSIPINKVLTKKELFKNIYTLPNQPEAIPYITSYYKKHWGFCIKHSKKKIFNKKYKVSDKFKVVIDSSFRKKGRLTYGEILIKGKSKKEILISTYICHPSMANNELSGPIVSLSLIKYFSKYNNLSKSLRFIFIPETIGSITYLSKNLKHLKNNLIGGYNLSCIGDDRKYSCMLTKYENTISDSSLLECFQKLNIKYTKYSFLKRGSDERQYNSPGIDLPIASIFRTKYGEYPEYHTSLDNFKLVTKSGTNGGFKVAKTAIKIMLKKIVPLNKILCEPQMGKRGLYSNLSTKNLDLFSRNLMNFLQYSDGVNDLFKISKLIKLNYRDVLKIYKTLKKEKLIE
jgi:aminopeptidase-like protein